MSQMGSTMSFILLKSEKSDEFLEYRILAVASGLLIG